MSKDTQPKILHITYETLENPVLEPGLKSYAYTRIADQNNIFKPGETIRYWILDSMYDALSTGTALDNNSAVSSLGTLSSTGAIPNVISDLNLLLGGIFVQATDFNSANLTFGSGIITDAGQRFDGIYKSYGTLNPEGNGWVEGTRIGNIWLDGSLTPLNETNRGDSGYWLVLHEILHSLGLEHPTATGINAPENQEYNNQKYTVMSYNYHESFDPGTRPAYFYPETLMLHDLLALIIGVRVAFRF